MQGGQRGRFLGRTQNYIVAGILTVVPVWITWLVFEFFLKQLSELGKPWVRALSRVLEQPAPEAARWLLEPWFQSTVAVILTLVALYLLGWLATLVVGRRVLHVVEGLIARIPLVKKVYGGTKNLIESLQQTSTAEVQRVVFIPFPTSAMKTVGLVTRVFTDPDTGRKLAAVYVPTTPNPTSGYLEIVPFENLVSTDWTIDQAMTFIISGGAAGPAHVHYDKGVAAPAEQSETEDAPLPERGRGRAVESE